MRMRRRTTTPSARSRWQHDALLRTVHLPAAWQPVRERICIESRRSLLQGAGEKVGNKKTGVAEGGGR